MQSNTTNKERLNVSEPTRQLTCFVSSPVGTDLSGLLRIIENNNLHVLDPNRFAPGAVKIAEKLIDGIKRADLIIGVLNSESSNANVMYELGCATALEKRILIIVSDESEVPSDLQGLVKVKSSLDNREAIEFAIQQILNAPSPGIISRKTLSAKTKSLKQKVDLFFEELAELNQNYSPKKLEDLVRRILSESGVSVISQPKYENIMPDFAIWIDELEPYFGNPILVEIKGNLDASKAKYTLEQSLHYMSLSKARAVLVFAFSISPDTFNTVPKLPNVFFFDLRELLPSLREKSLGEVIRDRYNSIVHGRIG